MAANFDEYEYLEKQLEQQRQGDGKSEKRSDRDKEKKHKKHSRSRSRDRSRERSKSHKSTRSRSRDKSDRKEKDKDRDRDRDREKDRDRNKSRDRDREKDRDRDRDRDRERDRDKDKQRSTREREQTPPEVRDAREKEIQLKELERATRTIFAYNLNIKAVEKDIFGFFSKAGKLTDIKLIMDRNTRRSKGMAYIEFARAEDVFNALTLTGQLLMGQAVMVKISEAEKNLAWEAQQQAKQNQAAATAMLGSLMAAAGPARVQIVNLRPELAESDLKSLFEPFGQVDSIQVVRDPAGRSQGFGFVTFSNQTDAAKAIQHWDGKELAGNLLKLQLAPIIPDGLLGGIVPPTLAELDEDEDSFKLNSQSRAALMNRLANSAGMSLAPVPTFPIVPVLPTLPVVAPQPQINTALMLEQGVLGPASPIATPCLLLKNMFNPSDQTEPTWVEDITQDTKGECSKFGPVVHIFVDKNSKGFVYIKFATTEAAQTAQRALHGRWYSGHQIVAEYQFLPVYNNHFGLR